MTTVSAVKQAIEETRKLRLADLGKPTDGDPLDCQRDLKALEQVIASPALLTMIANRLSDRGQAGNDAAKANIETLKDAMGFFEAQADLLARMGKPPTDRGPGTDVLADRNHNRRNALAWAIDQLSPPELAKRPDPCTVCGSANHHAVWHGKPEQGNYSDGEGWKG